MKKGVRDKSVRAVDVSRLMWAKEFPPTIISQYLPPLRGECLAVIHHLSDMISYTVAVAS